MYLEDFGDGGPTIFLFVFEFRSFFLSPKKRSTTFASCYLACPSECNINLYRDLGSVNLRPAARGSQEAGFTQPRAHLLADSC